MLARKINVKIVGFENFFDRILDGPLSVRIKNDNDRVNDPWFNLRPNVFLHDQEPVLYDAQKTEWQNLRFKLSPFDSRIIFLHSERNSPELNKMCQDMDLIPCYWFSNAALALEWYQNEQWTLHAENSKIPRLKYKFSGFNRLISYQRIYRPILTAMITDIVDPQYLRWSCSLVDPSNNLHVNKQNDINIPESHVKLLQRYENQTNPIRINMNFWELDDKKRISNSSPSSNSDYFRSTFCHVVTETLFYGSTLHLTEKSFRPIVNKRPFILAGPPGSLHYLRSYGFKTFSEFWDESYDLEQDPHKRLDKISKLIAEINKLDLFALEELLAKMQEILEHNYHHFYNKLPGIVKSELIENLEKAAALYEKHEWKGWMVQTLERIDETRLQRMLSATEIPDNVSSDRIREEFAMGNTESAEINLTRFLLRHFNASRDDTKETLLAKLEHVLR